MQGECVVLVNGKKLDGTQTLLEAALKLPPGMAHLAMLEKETGKAQSWVDKVKNEARDTSRDSGRGGHE